jgi:hypothetical protein
MKGHLRVTVAAGVIAVGAIVAAPVLASDAPSLPSTAIKLSGKEIVAIYDGSTFKFKDFKSDVPSTGTITFDLKNNITSGTLNGYGHTLHSIKLNGDKLCSQGGGFETCSSVYFDGADIYEVSAEGIVVSTLQKQ